MTPLRLHIPLWLRYGAAALACAALLGASSRWQDAQPCTQVEIRLAEQTDNFFLDLAGVKRLVGLREDVVSLPRREVDLAAIERTLRATGYVQHVAAYFGTGGKLHVDIRLRRPIARVVDGRGRSLYFDAENHKIRRSPQFTARVLLVRGQFAEPTAADPGAAAAGTDTLRDSTLRSIAPIVQHIDDDPFLRAQLAELHVDRNGDVTLYPQVGDVVVRFGRVERIAQKFALLRAFYRQVLSHTGWDYYRSINLKYAGQIVAEKADPDAPPVAAEPGGTPGDEPNDNDT